MKLPLSKLGATLVFLIPGLALAHAGHDDAPGETGAGPLTGPITITAEAEKNLGLKVEAAELRTLQKILTLQGTVELDPTKVAVVASRIAGRISRLAVKEGDQVSVGDFLVEIESRQVGDPPPRVELKAALKGSVIERPVFTGDNVEPDTRLLMIADLSEVYLVGRLFEGQVAQVKKGQGVRISAEAYPDDVLKGTVEGFTSRVDPETRTLGVRVRVANPDEKLLPNMLATMHVVTADTDTAITVPRAAVLGEAGNLFVFVQDISNPLVFRRTPVVLGLHDDRYAEVIEGVLPGDNVVTTANYQLQYVAPVAKPAPVPVAEPKASPTAPKGTK